MLEIPVSVRGYTYTGSTALETDKHINYSRCHCDDKKWLLQQSSNGGAVSSAAGCVAINQPHRASGIVNSRDSCTQLWRG